MSRILFALACFVAVGGLGCTTLGPVPGTTLQSMSPEPRAGVEVQAAAVPGYYLSDGTTDDPNGSPLPQLAAMFESGELLDAPGLGAGARWVGDSDSGPFFEPMLRYRVPLGTRAGVGVVGYGTRASGDAGGASYSLTRGGAELATDLRLTPRSSWAELHLFSGIAITGMVGDGRYCTNDDGFGTDCGDEPTDAAAELSGAFPSFFVGGNLDLGRHIDSAFHGVRLTGLASGGTMPRFVSGEREGTAGWVAGGLGASITFGAL